jgi:hypothetical protein
MKSASEGAVMKGLIRTCRCHLPGRAGVLCVGFAVVALLLPASGRAQSSRVGCGTTITADTRLLADLTNCPDNGIVIGADDISLDLNGHTVSGNGAAVAACPDGSFCDVGIDNTAGHRGVTITNGTVRDFDVGTFVLGADQNRIHRLSVADDSSSGVIIGDSTDTRVDHSASAHDGVSGIVVFDSQRLRIDHDSVTGTSGYAVPVFGSSRSRFDHNVLTNDQHGFLLGGSDQNPDSNHHNVVAHNRLYHGPGIEVAYSSDDLGAC